MTEEGWLGSIDPDCLLTWLQRSQRPRRSPRTVQLIVNAFLDRIADQFTDSVSVHARTLADQAAERALAWWELRAELGPIEDTLQRLEHGRILIWALRVPDLEGESYTPETRARSVAEQIR